MNEEDKAKLKDLCALNGVDEVVCELSRLREFQVGPRDKYQRACQIAWRIMQQTGEFEVQIVRKL